MNPRITSAALTIAAAVGLSRVTFSSAAPPEKEEFSHLPLVSRSVERIPDWPHRQSYRAQVRAARRRRNIQKRGGAK